MADDKVDGLYTKLYLYVTAKTLRGQTVHVSASSSSSSLDGAAIPLVTSPSEWPVWRTLTPIIVSRGVAHHYHYSLGAGQAGAQPEADAARVVVAAEAEMHVRDVFGCFDEADDVYAQVNEAMLLQRTDSSDLEPVFSRVMICCYHLPVRVFKVEGQWRAVWGESLIARTEGSIADETEAMWLGTVTPEGGETLSCDDEAEIEACLAPMRCVPLFSEHATLAYQGFCKQVLWPSFHNVDMLDQSGACWKADVADPAEKWDQAATGAAWWSAYERMNNDFCDALLKIVKEGDTVWVHDYHLMLLPSLLAEAAMFRADAATVRRKARIVFFLHIPFPTSQIFRSLIRGGELLHGVAGADVVGFHVFDHARHFLNACKRLMGLLPKSVQGGITGVEYKGRTVMVVVRHVSIEPEVVTAALESEETADAACRLVASLEENGSGGRPLLLASIDSCQRLSGIALKLAAYERFLNESPHWVNQVVLVQYATRGSTRLEDEQRTSAELVKIVDRITAIYPGSILYKELPTSAVKLTERLALWQQATVLVGTAIREGHSLAPFEYVLARRARPGVVLASEFSATASLLNGAVRLNPFDVADTAGAFDTALGMPAAERAARHARDLPYVLSRPSGKWTRDILKDMWLVNRQKRVCPDGDEAHAVIPLNMEALKRAFTNAKRKVLVFDFGGTLVKKGPPMGIYHKRNLGPSLLLNSQSTDHLVCSTSVKALKAVASISNPDRQCALEDGEAPVVEEAEYPHALPEALSAALSKLCQDDATTIYVVSGATMHALTSSLGEWPKIGLAANNGLCYARPQQAWDKKRNFDFYDYGTDWEHVKRVALPIFRRYTARTNGSEILAREPGIAWSYYRSDPEWGRIQAAQVIGELERELAPLDVVVHQFDGMIEMVPKRAHKGNVVKEILREASAPSPGDAEGVRPDFILCCGDGLGDEKMFSSVYSSLADATAQEYATQHTFTITVGKKPSRALFYLRDHAHVVETLTYLASDDAAGQ
ncbi:glycosyltransferase family 20-domain-containing protein [Pelagophyceae sp. CCMP2097]|nr:glycosyltransferase family 20-domain-containing protein [Pelagophyceae sp. CCMP2097]|mmetsp:Transcript_24823/g.84998  ORF Transcript_24823/g.84998 Transcript_24823/m.84998 type:complete len:1002 (-) Transcript_24823:74-3079(-)